MSLLRQTFTSSTASGPNQPRTPPTEASGASNDFASKMQRKIIKFIRDESNTLQELGMDKMVAAVVMFLTQLLEDLVQSQTKLKGSNARRGAKQPTSRRSSPAVSQEDARDRSMGSETSGGMENNPKFEVPTAHSRRSSVSDSSVVSSQAPRRGIGKPPLRKQTSSPNLSAMKQHNRHPEDEMEEYHPSFPIDHLQSKPTRKASAGRSITSDDSNTKSWSYAKQLDEAYHEILESKHRMMPHNLPDVASSLKIAQTFGDWDNTINQGNSQMGYTNGSHDRQSRSGLTGRGDHTPDGLKASSGNSLADYLTLSHDPENTYGNPIQSGDKHPEQSVWSPGAGTQRHANKDYSSGVTRAETASQNKNTARGENPSPNVFNFDSHQSRTSEYQSGKFGTSNGGQLGAHSGNEDHKTPAYEPLSKTLLEKINLKIPGTTPLAGNSHQDKQNQDKEWNSLGNSKSFNENETSGVGSSYLSQGKNNYSPNTSLPGATSKQYSSLQTSQASSLHPTTSPNPHPSLAPPPSTSPHPSPSPPPPVEYYIALYTFQGEKTKDLSFRKGELVRVIKKTPLGWWLAQIDHRIGQVPSNFLGVPRPEDLRAVGVTGTTQMTAGM